ncbi:DUF1800 domain-containing protein [Paracoccus sp. M683]|uniref:DUF1800 domain-containing protein n=1 Tax=Paracoccus sp. M683 TaxID=2594268 RepID=UPI00117C894A|nr:DUF1800 domain-containing protein [Paracoccus sp. M683]TRW97691.1 DUF1800 domain-containing protein [Paracoccus sp. M683]
MSVSFPELAAIRLGYGLSPLMAPPQSAAEVLGSVALSLTTDDAVTLQQVRESAEKLAGLTKARAEGGAAATERHRAYTTELSFLPMVDLRRRMARALDAPAGFGERLVQFWADHFTVRADGSGAQMMAMAFVDEAIRPHLNGRFEDMLIAANTHPMMLRYLNQDTSVGPGSRVARNNPQRQLGLNENLARETIELHTLGVNADYDQTDVRQLAELMTGLTFRRRHEGVFNGNQAEPGAEVVLGRSYGGDGPARIEDIHAALTDLARYPATARHLSFKLAQHFLADQPRKAVIDDLTAVWRETRGDLPSVYAALIGHQELAATFRQKVRQPFDYLVAAMRALGVTGQQILAIEPKRIRNDMHRAMARMGQPWNRPTGPDGWPEPASDWITPQGLAARIEWALKMPARLADPLPDPRGFLAVALGDTAGEALTWAVPKAESVLEGVAIVLASNEFNRR